MKIGDAELLCTVTVIPAGLTLGAAFLSFDSVVETRQRETGRSLGPPIPKEGLGNRLLLPLWSLQKGFDGFHNPSSKAGTDCAST